MGMMQKRKGRSGEQELVRLLRDHLGVSMERNLQQTRDGGHDLNGLDALSIECKRAAKPILSSWWTQTIDQAKRAGRIPILAYRLDRKPWAFVVALSDLLDDCKDQARDLNLTATLTTESFCSIAKKRWI